MRLKVVLVTPRHAKVSEPADMQINNLLVDGQQIDGTQVNTL